MQAADLAGQVVAPGQDVAGGQRCRSQTAEQVGRAGVEGGHGEAAVASDVGAQATVRTTRAQLAAGGGEQEHGGVHIDSAVDDNQYRARCRVRRQGGTHLPEFRAWWSAGREGGQSWRVKAVH